MKKMSRKERLDISQAEFDKIITPEVLEEALELQKQMSQGKPEDYWRKLR